MMRARARPLPLRTTLVALVLAILPGSGPLAQCTDSDGDAVCDADDNCPFDPNPNQGSVHKLNGPFAPNGDIEEYAVAPSGAVAVYRANQDVATADELYAVTAPDGTPLKLNPALGGNRDVTAFAIAPDATRVAYRADQDQDEVFELYAVPIAGGTDLMVEVNARRLRPAAFLDLSRVAELQEWGRDDDRVFVGAGMTFARIERELLDFEPLAAAARSVASPQIRNRATIGGNLGTASPAGDSLPVLAAYDADVVVASAAGGERCVTLADFLVGPKRTSLAGDELIVGVEWTQVDGVGSFSKVGRRSAMVVAVASACLQAKDRRVRLALGSVAPTVVRASLATSISATSSVRRCDFCMRGLVRTRNCTKARTR